MTLSCIPQSSAVEPLKTAKSPSVLQALRSELRSAGPPEWQPLAPSDMEAGLWDSLSGFGIRLESADYVVMRESDDPARKGAALQPFAHDGAAAAIAVSVNQALGSSLFQGQGESMKVVADGNAVFMGFRTLLDHSRRHPEEAFLVLGDEGERDSSISLRVGSIFYRGAVIPYKDIDGLRKTLVDLLRRGVRIRGVIGDALEVTNEFVEGRPNSWSVLTMVDLPQKEEALMQIALIPDLLRVISWVYHAPAEAEDLSPFDLPEDGFRRIASAAGVDPVRNPDLFAAWMAVMRQATLHGKRSFLEPNRRQGEELAGRFPGFETFFPDDGDLFPSVLAAMGLLVDGHYVVTNSRQGSNEGFIARVAANNVEGGRFVQSFVSYSGTEKATGLRKDNAHNYSANERAIASGYGVRTSDLEGVHTNASWPYRGVIAMTSVSGASRSLVGEWTEWLQAVSYERIGEGPRGRVVLHTFVLAQDGSAYVIRFTFAMEDLEDAKQWIKLASRLPSGVRLKPETRKLGDLVDVVDPQNRRAVIESPDQIIVKVFRYISQDQLEALLQEKGVGYHLTFLDAGQIGKGAQAEYYRTKGHYHPDVAELVEIYEGRGSILLWPVTEEAKREGDTVLRVSLKRGDKFFIPRGWAHITINEGDEQMVFGNWILNGARFDYELIAEQGGAPWFVGPQGAERNPSHVTTPELVTVVPNGDYLETLGVRLDRDVWSMAMVDEAGFLALLDFLIRGSAEELSIDQLYRAASEARRDDIERAIEQLDSDDRSERLEALRTLRTLELQGETIPPVGPRLVSYEHVHTTVSYGHHVPDLVSVAHMIWAAHQAGAERISIVEHEALSHIWEAQQAAAIVNQERARPLRFVAAVEFKIPIDRERLPGPDGDRLRAAIKANYGHDEAAWIVAYGAGVTPEMVEFVRLFQRAKVERARAQLAKLSRHYGLTGTDREFPLEDIVTIDSETGAMNITDRQLAFAVARRVEPDANPKRLAALAGEIRKAFNPGGFAHVPYPASLPGFAEFVGRLNRAGVITAFTAQLKGDQLVGVMPDLVRWSVGALDIAGILPDEADSEAKIATVIEQAEAHDLHLFGGSDFPAVSESGWPVRTAWMDHPRLVKSFGAAEALTAAKSRGLSELRSASAFPRSFLPDLSSRAAPVRAALGLGGAEGVILDEGWLAALPVVQAVSEGGLAVVLVSNGSQMGFVGSFNQSLGPNQAQILAARTVQEARELLRAERIRRKIPQAPREVTGRILEPESLTARHLLRELGSAKVHFLTQAELDRIAHLHGLKTLLDKAMFYYRTLVAA